jgi:Tol biopolymer transport system component
MYSGLDNPDYIDDDIGILDLKDMKIINLTRNFFYEGDPIWSKDEKSIYYVMKNGPEYSVMEMRLKDKNITKIYTTDDFIYDLSLSPDGEKILFSKQEDLYRASIWLLNLKDKEVKQITSGKYLDVSPVFYKDDEILFISNRTNNTRSIFKMNLNKLKPSIIPNTTDSSKIIDVSDNQCLFRITRDGYFNRISIINLQNGRVKRYFGEGCYVSDIWDIWFPGLYNGKLCYYEGESLKELIPKEIPLD